MSVTCKEMRRIEEAAIATGTSVETLMEEAGDLMARAVTQFYPIPGECRVFFGKGHNGGDALVAARHLLHQGWMVKVQKTFAEAELAPLTRKKLGEFLEASQETCFAAPSTSYGPKILLDGLLGIGAAPRGGNGKTTALREPILSAAREINRQAREEHAIVMALDIPTGLDADSGEADPETIRANVTLCVGFAKRGLLADSALPWVGRLAILPLPALTAQAGLAATRDTTITPGTLSALVPIRPFDLHKGQCGRVGIVAGSRGFTGAAVMAANAAVRGGAGLVSLFVTPDIYVPVASAAMPEVMVTPLDGYLGVLERPLDALAIGPGLGREDAQDILAVCEYFKGPAVIDADALNLMADHMETLHRAQGPRLLTPHPGEMARLFPEGAGLTRRETAQRFLETHGNGAQEVTLLLKGARTLVAQGTGDALRLAYNTTGNPGMASGGMGDVLTGTCAALLGQGLETFDAARLGCWLCGRAAELALFTGERSQESLSATDLYHYMGRAFRDARYSGAY